jgi:hypothetical protein
LHARAVSEWRVSRLSNALLAALALHGLLLLTHARHLPERPLLPLSKPDELVEVEETLPDEASSAFATSASMQPARHGASAQPAVVAAVAARASSRSLETETPADSLSGVEASSNGAASAEPGAASSAEAAVGKPARKIDFGIDNGFFMRPASEELPRVPKPAFQRQLEAALSADDVRRGLARGGALIGSLNAAVRDKGPVRGEALLSVTVGPDGGLTAVEFLRGSASEWSSALESFRVLAARKRLRVPPGARGLRVTFSVQAKVQRPSGKEVNSSGLDVEPSGLALRGTFDVADVGAGAQRLVYARVVSEEVL